MDNLILQSVIDITGQRDLDSLEFSLVASLAEMLPVTSISIHKKYSENVTNSVEEVVHLKVITIQNNNQDYQWNKSTKIVEADELTEMCLLNSNVISRKIDSSYRIVFPILAENMVIGVLRIDSHKDLADHLQLIENIIKIYGNYLIVLDESERDKLTGLYNRRTFDRKLDRLLQTQVRKKELYLATGGTNERRQSDTNSHAWLVVMDCDNFKAVNDTYGHVYGDEVLLTLSQKMKSFFRNSDLLFRFGGDEFVIVLEPIPFKRASRILEDFRKMIADTNFPLIGKITISVGYAVITDNEYAPTVLHRADKALYQAKEDGRNRVCNYEALLQQGMLNDQKTTGAIDLFK